MKNYNDEEEEDIFDDKDLTHSEGWKRVKERLNKMAPMDQEKMKVIIKDLAKKEFERRLSKEN